MGPIFGSEPPRRRSKCTALRIGATWFRSSCASTLRNSLRRSVGGPEYKSLFIRTVVLGGGNHPAGRLACAAQARAHRCVDASALGFRVACDKEACPRLRPEQPRICRPRKSPRGADRRRRCGAAALLPRLDLALAGVFGLYASE